MQSARSIISDLIASRMCFRNSSRGEGGDDEDDDGEEVNRWNLRKCSAAGLDVLSTVFGDELLPIVLPIVEQKLRVRTFALPSQNLTAVSCALTSKQCT